MYRALTTGDPVNDEHDTFITFVRNTRVNGRKRASRLLILNIPRDTFFFLAHTHENHKTIDAY